MPKKRQPVRDLAMISQVVKPNPTTRYCVETQLNLRVLKREPYS